MQQHSFQISDVFVTHWLQFLIHIQDKLWNFVTNVAGRCREKMSPDSEDCLVILSELRRLLKEREKVVRQRLSKVSNIARQYEFKFFEKANKVCIILCSVKLTRASV